MLERNRIVMNPISNQFKTIEQVANQYKHVKTETKINSTNLPVQSFEQILIQQSKNESSTQLKFSKHASERLQSRNMNLTQDQLKRLENGTKRAEEKGIKESLVMVDDMAFIVNIKSNTVVTAVNNRDEKVFTNIDGAIVI